MNPRKSLSALVFRSGATLRTDVVILIARLVVGFGFLQHGFAKVMNGPHHFASSLSGLGVAAPEIMSRVTIAAELTCGSAVLAGALVPLMCVPMAFILMVAMYYVHLPFGFSSIKLQAVTPEGIKFGPPGYEVILLYFVGLSVLAILGAGPVSVDSWLKRRFGL